MTPMTIDRSFLVKDEAEANTELNKVLREVGTGVEVEWEYSPGRYLLEVFVPPRTQREN